MARSTAATKLDDYERRYRALAIELAGIGFISSGSVTRRYTRCTAAGCKCNAEPPEPHGPYYQWTTKVRGKTVTRRLSPEEARLYRDWIANDRKLRRIVEQMRKVAAKAREVKLQEATRS